MSEAAPNSATSARGLARGEVGLLALLGGLIALTLLTIGLPELHFAALAPEIDLLINGLATLVAGAAAWLAWLRYRHMADISSVYQAAAFVLFTVSVGAQTAAGLGIGEDALGLSLSAPGQAPLYAWSMLRLIAGGLLLRSAWLRLRPPAAHRRPALVVVVALAGGLLAAAASYALEPLLPPLLGDEALERLGGPDDFLGPLPGITLLEIGLQSVAMLLLGGAALLYSLAARSGTAPAARYLAAGLLFAAFAQVHFALFPGVYSDLVTSSDLLRICFYAFVVFGIQAEAGATLRQLRSANRELRELRDVELARASLAERARLAREVHDGLAQSLWLAKLATERLAGASHASDIEEVRRELSGLLDSGIAEARQTVVALRDAGPADAPFAETLARHLRHFADQTGLEARLESSALDEQPPPPRTAAELLRIAQEALNNVRKHADATVVTVEVEYTGGALRLAVRDNGIGFDAAADHTGYGLESMRERAEAVGGRLSVETSPSGGTSVIVEVPAA